MHILQSDPGVREIGYDGSAAFFFQQAAEENGHILNRIHYFKGVRAESIITAIERTSKIPSNDSNLLSKLVWTASKM